MKRRDYLHANDKQRLIAMMPNGQKACVRNIDAESDDLDKDLRENEWLVASVDFRLKAACWENILFNVPFWFSTF